MDGELRNDCDATRRDLDEDVEYIPKSCQQMRMNFRFLALFFLLLIFKTGAFSATIPATEDSYGYRAKLTTAANKATLLPVDGTHRAFIFGS